MADTSILVSTIQTLLGPDGLANVAVDDWRKREKVRLEEEAIRGQRLTAQFSKTGLPEAVRDEWCKHRHRIALLRSRLGHSLALIGSGVAVAFITAFAMGSANFQFTREGLRGLQTISLALFAWATLGRLGYEGQSVRGTTLPERVDQGIFRWLYFLGTYFGTLSILGQS